MRVEERATRGCERQRARCAGSFSKSDSCESLSSQPTRMASFDAHGLRPHLVDGDIQTFWGIPFGWGMHGGLSWLLSSCLMSGRMLVGRGSSRRLIQIEPAAPSSLSRRQAHHLGGWGAVGMRAFQSAEVAPAAGRDHPLLHRDRRRRLCTLSPLSL